MTKPPYSTFLTTAHSKRILLLFAVALVLSSCATIPPVKVRYYLPETTVDVSVQRLMGCRSQDEMYSIVAVDSHTIGLTNAADTSAEHWLPLVKEGASYGGLDHTLTFSEDGRLKSIDTDATGAGGAIVRSAFALASFFSGPVSMGLDPEDSPEAARIEAICKYIEGIGVTSKETPTYLILRYSARFKAEELGTYECGTNNSEFLPDGLARDLVPDFVSQLHINEIETLLGDTSLDFFDPVRLKPSPASCPEPPVDWVSEEAKSKWETIDHETLVARQGAYGELSLAYGDDNTLVTGRLNDQNKGSNADPFGTMFNARVAISQWGVDYDIPVPYPRLFGDSTFSAAFGDDGSLSTIAYSSKGGSDALTSGLESLTDALAGPTTSEEAAQVKAEADLIAQQQRLLRCQLAPDECQ